MGVFESVELLCVSHSQSLFRIGNWPCWRVFSIICTLKEDAAAAAVRVDFFCGEKEKHVPCESITLPKFENKIHTHRTPTHTLHFFVTERTFHR